MSGPSTANGARVTYPFHERLKLENFTAFSHLELEFVPGINVLVGQNGTGKTHVLKALYAYQMAQHLSILRGHEGDDNFGPIRFGTIDFTATFLSTYKVASHMELQHSALDRSSIQGDFGPNKWHATINAGAFSTTYDTLRPETSRPVFIPAFEMMAHAKNMLGIMRDYADFDRTCFDFLAMVQAESTSAQSEKSFIDVSALKNLVPGSVTWNAAEQRFYLSEGNKQLPFSLVAEGVRKISALYRLIENGWIKPGSVLFWDEPEVNLNPQWMDEVIEVLVSLARNNVQIFLATHSYVVLKQIELSLRAQPKRAKNRAEARYFLFTKDNDGSTATWSDSFSDLEPNPILNQYDKMLAEDWRLSSQVSS